MIYYLFFTAMPFKFLLAIQVFSVIYLETNYASRASKKLEHAKIILDFPIPNRILNLLNFFSNFVSIVILSLRKLEC